MGLGLGLGLGLESGSGSGSGSGSESGSGSGSGNWGHNTACSKVTEVIIIPHLVDVGVNLDVAASTAVHSYLQARLVKQLLEF